MKLKNKLIPILTTAFATTAIAPLIANCGGSGGGSSSGQVTGTYTYKEIVNGQTQKLTPSYSPMGGSLTDSAATDAYFNAIRQTSNRLAEEVAYGLCGGYYSPFANSSYTSDSNATYTVQATSYKENGVWRVSFTSRLVANVTSIDSNGQTQKWVIDQTTSASNYKMNVVYKYSQWGTQSITDLAEAQADSKWEAKNQISQYHYYLDGKEQEIPEEEKKYMNFTYNSRNITSETLYYANIGYRSYYLSNTSHSSDPEPTPTSETVAMTKLSAGSYVSSTTSTYNITSGKTYKYTGVYADTILGTTPSTIAIATTSGTEVLGVSISSVKVNGTTCSSTGVSLTYYLPSGISYGASLTIEIVYSASSTGCATAIALG